MQTLVLPIQNSKEGQMRRGLIQSLLTATLVAGTLDALAGIVFFDFSLGKMSIVQILQWIASGVFGQNAFAMGALGAFYGLVFHYVVAFGFSVGLFSVFEKVRVLKQYPVFSGLAYGGAIWLVMNLIVLPLSNTVIAPFDPFVALVGIIWHMVLVGLPIVHFANQSTLSLEKKSGVLL